MVKILGVGVQGWGWVGMGCGGGEWSNGEHNKG